MMCYRRSWKSHEIPWAHLKLFAVNLGNAAPRENVDPFLLSVMQVVDKKFLPWWNPHPAHPGALKSDQGRKPSSDYQRLRIPGMRTSLFCCTNILGAQQARLFLRHIHVPSRRLNHIASVVS